MALSVRENGERRRQGEVGGYDEDLIPSEKERRRRKKDWVEASQT